jgi:adenine phosphoribosyltransferase
MSNLAQFIRDVPNFPKPGIIFKDITPLLQDARAFRQAVTELAQPFRAAGVDLVVAAEARGFIFGGAVARELGVGFVPVRKPGKLPAATTGETYQLEYGTDTLEIHTDAIRPGQRVLLLDDLLATGGTMAAMANLVEKLGATVVGIAFLIELAFLHGREKLKGRNVVTLIQYEAE